MVGAWLLGAAIFFISVTAFSVGAANEQEAEFKVGERLTYTVAFEKFTNVAYVELYTVSRGKLGDADAVELRARVKTLDFLSAAFYLVDEARTIFASPESGVPLHITRTQYTGGLPRDYVQNNLSNPAPSYDLVTMIYKIRHSQGSGSFNIYEGDRAYPVTFQLVGNERVRAELGEYDTTVHAVQSEYFTEIGVRDLKINLSTDEAKLPVSMKFRTTKGEFRARLASVQNTEPQVEQQPTPTPLPVSTPRPGPQPTATPRPYVNNVPLPNDLSFDLGETLDYRVSAGGQTVANVRLQAAERKQFQTLDSLLLTAVVMESAPGGPLTKNDFMRAQVNPETLTPRSLEMNLSGPLAVLNQSIVFDERTNTVSFGGTNRVEIPVGTHNLLSLIYAIRSFNLKPSRDTTNPINDTRVAVFWERKANIFSVRPSNADVITLEGKKVSAQQVAITTGDPQLDSMSIKVWLSTDERRVPLRFTLGRFQADLISATIIPPK